MFIFMLVFYILGAVGTGIAALFIEDNKLFYLAIMLFCILNAVIFCKLKDMETDVKKLKEHCGLNNENTNNTTPPSEE